MSRKSSKTDQPKARYFLNTSGKPDFKWMTAVDEIDINDFLTEHSLNDAFLINTTASSFKTRLKLSLASLLSALLPRAFKQGDTNDRYLFPPPDKLVNDEDTSVYFPPYKSGSFNFISPKVKISDIPVIRSVSQSDSWSINGYVYIDRHTRALIEDLDDFLNVFETLVEILNEYNIEVAGSNPISKAQLANLILDSASTLLSSSDDHLAFNTPFPDLFSQLLVHYFDSQITFFDCSNSGRFPSINKNHSLVLINFSNQSLESCIGITNDIIRRLGNTPRIITVGQFEPDEIRPIISNEVSLYDSDIISTDSLGLWTLFLLSIRGTIVYQSALDLFHQEHFRKLTDNIDLHDLSRIIPTLDLPSYSKFYCCQDFWYLVRDAKKRLSIASISPPRNTSSDDGTVGTKLDWRLSKKDLAHAAREFYIYRHKQYPSASKAAARVCELVETTPPITKEKLINNMKYYGLTGRVHKKETKKYDGILLSDVDFLKLEMNSKIPTSRKS